MIVPPASGGPMPAPVAGVVSGPGVPEGAEEADDTPEGYEIGGVLGRGGMGEVHAAHDRGLGRQVAMKTARASDPGSAARLAREARLTARLEHPNIVPVYASGRDAAGRAWYTMRVLPGRSLADAIHEAPGLAGRIRLVRHVLGAADALAYAHGRGVLHRDLKPANVMVGPFGETVVADWGLACAIDEQATERGGGTPGYMSPEQERGDELDGRADVYALGAVLHELLTGAPPTRGTSGSAGSPATVTAAAPPEPPRSGVPPPELVAIAARATRPDREERYPGARAFADDLLAWFEGRRVAAYSYSPRELAARTWSAWRLPITIGAVSVVVIVAAVTVGWYRTSVLRTRAELSETRAISAQQAERSAFSAALVAEAWTAAEDDRRADAEILAANALVREESPDARGVLARFGGRPRMPIIARAPLRPATSRALSPDGARLLEAGPDGARIVDPLRPDDVLARWDGELRAAVFAGDADHVVLLGDHTLYVWTPPAAPVLLPGSKADDADFGQSAVAGVVAAAWRSSSMLVNTLTGTVTTWRGCGTAADQSVLLTAEDEVYVGCSDRRIVRGRPGEPGTPWTRLEERDDAHRLALPASGMAGVLVGTTRGALLHLDAEGREVARRTLGSEAIYAIAVAPNRVAASSADGLIGVWADDSGLPLGRLSSRAARLAWRGDDVLRIVGQAAEDRSVPSPPRPHVLRVGAGISSLALSPDERDVAVCEGDGTVAILSLSDGTTHRSWKWQDGVAKDVAYSPDGRYLATAMARGEDQRIFDLQATTGDGALPAVFRTSLRRVAWLRSGWLLAEPYVPGLLGWSPGASAATTLSELQFNTIELDGTGARGAAISVDDGIWRLNDGAPPTARRIATVPENRGVEPLGEDTLVLVRDAMVRLDPRGAEIDRVPTPRDTTDIAVSADGRWVAVGTLDGNVEVSRVGGRTPVARLSGHKARIAEMQFTRDGSWLLTGSWDDTVRVWSLADLEASGDALKTRIEAEWGRTLDEVLAGRL